MLISVQGLRLLSAGRRDSLPQTDDALDDFGCSVAVILLFFVVAVVAVAVDVATAAVCCFVCCCCCCHGLKATEDEQRLLEDPVPI